VPFTSRLNLGATSSSSSSSSSSTTTQLKSTETLRKLQYFEEKLEHMQRVLSPPRRDLENKIQQQVKSAMEARKKSIEDFKRRQEEIFSSITATKNAFSSSASSESNNRKISSLLDDKVDVLKTISERRLSSGGVAIQRSNGTHNTTTNTSTYPTTNSVHNGDFDTAEGENKVNRKLFNDEHLSNGNGQSAADDAGLLNPKSKIEELKERLKMSMKTDATKAASSSSSSSPDAPKYPDDFPFQSNVADHTLSSSSSTPAASSSSTPSIVNTRSSSAARDRARQISEMSNKVKEEIMYIRRRNIENELRQQKDALASLRNM